MHEQNEMALEGIMLSETSQTKTNTVSHLYVQSKKKTEVIETENR